MSDAAVEPSPNPQEPFDQAVAPLPKYSLWQVLRRTRAEFAEDKGTDLAAALTYYGVLSLFPGLLAVVATFGVIGDAEKSVQSVLRMLEPIMAEAVIDQIGPAIEQLASTQAAGWTLLASVLLALWSASGYVGAFGKTMNTVYEVNEGRSIWRLRPLQLLVTLFAVLTAVAGLAILVLSGPVARTIGQELGLTDQVLQVWSIAKWPVLLLLVILVVAMLYRALPNVKFPTRRIITVGSTVAILGWVAASIGFGFYVTNFGSYNKTYGSLAGVIVALLWLWLTNVFLIFGAQLDAELLRRRQLYAGVAAEETLQLPLRSERTLAKAEAKRHQRINRAKAVREAAAVGAPLPRATLAAGEPVSPPPPPPPPPPTAAAAPSKQVEPPEQLGQVVAEPANSEQTPAQGQEHAPEQAPDEQPSSGTEAATPDPEVLLPGPITPPPGSQTPPPPPPPPAQP